MSIDSLDCLRVVNGKTMWTKTIQQVIFWDFLLAFLTARTLKTTKNIMLTLVFLSTQMLLIYNYLQRFLSIVKNVFD